MRSEQYRLQKVMTSVMAVGWQNPVGRKTAASDLTASRYLESNQYLSEGVFLRDLCRAGENHA